MGACGFCLSCSGFLRENFFSLSLMVFGGWIGDLCKSCFVGGDFLLLGGVVCVGVVDPMCVFAWTISLDFSLFLTCWVCACWNSAECSIFRSSWNFSQSFGTNWISFSMRALYFLSWLTPYDRGISVFCYVGPYSFPCFKVGHVLHVSP